MTKWLFALCGLALCSPVHAQTNEDPEPSRLKTSIRWERFENTTGAGSKTLGSMLVYPSQKRALVEKEGGWPVIVFLHGSGGFALAYTALGRELAARGYIVVLSNTAISDAELQRQDGNALFVALQASNQDEDSFWHGGLNMERVGLAGHSMGGGSTAHVLASNPGYAAGFCFAPWQGGLDFDTDCGDIEVPVGIVHGEGDTTLAWELTGKRLFDALPARIEKFLYLRDGAITHMNVALRLPFASRVDKALFADHIELCAAFFAKHLQKDGEALKSLFANTADDDHFVELFQSE